VATGLTCAFNQAGNEAFAWLIRLIVALLHHIMWQGADDSACNMSRFRLGTSGAADRRYLLFECDRDAPPVQTTGNESQAERRSLPVKVAER